jgi:hypothetical protein
VTAPIPAPPLPQEPDGNEPPVRPAVVEEMLKLFVKAVRAHQLYLPNNPTYHRAIEVLRAAFIPIWDVVDSLPLQVQELEFKYHGHAVLREDAKSSDSLPWLFFKDGVRMISIQRDFELEELTNLLDILQRVRKASPVGGRVRVPEVPVRRPGDGVSHTTGSWRFDPGARRQFG